VRSQSSASRIALLNGLLGIRRAPGERTWRFFWLDFSGNSATFFPGATAPSIR
jgi:hypothetical protein